MCALRRELLAFHLTGTGPEPARRSDRVELVGVDVTEDLNRVSSSPHGRWLNSYDPTAAQALMFTTA
jgi:hypothetical protein